MAEEETDDWVSGTGVELNNGTHSFCPLYWEVVCVTNLLVQLPVGPPSPQEHWSTLLV